MIGLKKIVLQFVKFLFVSGTGWMIDFSLYLEKIEMVFLQEKNI